MEGDAMFGTNAHINEDTPLPIDTAFVAHMRWSEGTVRDRKTVEDVRLSVSSVLGRCRGIDVFTAHPFPNIYFHAYARFVGDDRTHDIFSLSNNCAGELSYPQDGSYFLSLGETRRLEERTCSFAVFI